MIAGCGGSSSKSASGPLPSSTTTASPNPSSSAGTVAVAMRNIRFVPASITVKAGQAIKWTNDDPVSHTVTADRGASFNSGTVDFGKTYQFTPTKPGTIHYYCTIHGQIQSGTITVTK